MKTKNNTNHLVLAILLTFSFCILLTSCPTSPPLAPTDGFNPYLAPEEPSGLQATNGYADSISLTWDSIDDATSYMIWATPADQYGSATKDTNVNEPYSKLLARGFELIETVENPSCKLRGLDKNTSYIFSIVAMKTMESKSGTNTVLYSEPSNFVQGSTSGDITLSAVASSKTVTLFWDISNLYSVLNDSEEKLPLYNYRISVYKKLNSSNDWGEAKIIGSNDAKNQSYSFGASALEFDSLYDFKICLEILGDKNEVINTVESTSFTLTTDSTPIPESVEDLKANCGKERNQVTITWTAPALSEHGDLKHTFIIERAETGSNTWTELSSSVNDNGDGTYYTTDTEVEDNKTYNYRIINGYQIEGKTPVYQDRKDATAIQNVYALWVPENIEFTFTEASDKKSGKVEVSYKYTPPTKQGTIKCYVGGEKWPEVDLEDKQSLTEVEGSTLEVSIEDENSLMYYNFYIRFTLDDQEILKAQSPNDETLGTPGTSNLLKNLKATTDWVQAVNLSWEEETALDDSYTYEIYQDNELVPGLEISTNAENATLKSVILKTDDYGKTHNYRVKVSKDKDYDIEEATGQTLAVPTGLSATDGTSIDAITITWTQVDNANLVYKLKYSYDNGENWKDFEESAVGAGTATLAAQKDKTDGSPVSFKLVVSNKEQTATTKVESTVESSVATGSVLGPALLNVRIENDGLDPDKITIKWDKVTGADYYKLKRGDTYLEWKNNADTYSDSVEIIKNLEIESPLNAQYTYTVIPCIDDGTENGVEAIGETATGKLFAPPEGITASKGNSDIKLTWNSVENATAYKIQKYVVDELKHGKVISKEEYGTPITVTGSTTYTESLLNEKIIFYEICSVQADGTTSQWQNYYSTTKNSLGFDEPSNVGYTLAKVTSLTAKTVINKSSGYYEDYVEVTWSMVPGATSYKLISYTGAKNELASTIIPVISANEIASYSTEASVDNRKSGTGYLSYNPETDKYTYYDGAGLFKDSYEITQYDIIAVKDTVLSDTTTRNTKVYRQPNGSYWIKPILNILQPAFTAANSNFGGDWWPDNAWAGGDVTKSYTYEYTYETDKYKTGMQFCLKTTGIDNFYTSSNNYLAITSYKDATTGLTLETSDNIQFVATDGGGWTKPGNLGTDSLTTIGYNGNGTIKVTPEKGSHLKPFTITFKNINVKSASDGSYIVTIDGKSYETADSSDFIRVL